MTALPAPTKHAWENPFIRKTPNASTTSQLKDAHAGQFAEARPKYLASSHTHRWESKCLHLLQIGPRCFTSVIWMTTEAAAEKHHPPTSHSASLCSQAQQMRERALLLTVAARRGAAVLPGSFGRKLSRPASHGGSMHGAGSLELVCCPHSLSPLSPPHPKTAGCLLRDPALSAPQQPRCSGCGAGRPGAGLVLLL